jgi:hypothetical protein
VPSGVFMHKSLGPKTGTYEPPSLQTNTSSDLWDTVRKMHTEMCKSEANYKNVHQLTAELINAYERNDKAEIDRLIKEFKELK